MLASALHSIAIGNLLPARVRTICVDMVESVPVKLGNRGSMQAIGLVTDVGYFLEKLQAIGLVTDVGYFLEKLRAELQ